MKITQTQKIMISSLALIVIYLGLTTEMFSIQGYRSSLNQQPTSCIEWNTEKYCPGDAGFGYMFNCNEEKFACPSGKQCMSDGNCALKEIDYTMLVIAVGLASIWILKPENK